jgi:hypothetical protein
MRRLYIVLSNRIASSQKLFWRATYVRCQRYAVESGIRVADTEKNTYSLIAHLQAFSKSLKWFARALISRQSFHTSLKQSVRVFF